MNLVWALFSKIRPTKSIVGLIVGLIFVLRLRGESIVGLKKSWTNFYTSDTCRAKVAPLGTIV